MKIDLREDAKNILTYIKKRIDDFDAASNEGPGDGSIVHQINFGYSTDQSGFFALILDTRDDATTDGEWNSYLGDGTVLELPHWSDATDSMGEEAVTIIDHKGESHTFDDFPGEEPLAELFGSMLLDLMLTARENGTFKPLPTADVCHLAIEDQLGGWGWPMYDDRGKPGTIL